MLSIVYEDDSTRPKVTVLFALMPADGFNFITTQDWLNELENVEDNKVCSPIQRHLDNKIFRFWKK